MEASIRAAQATGVAVGAHPSLNDRKNFGRTELPVSPAEVFRSRGLSTRCVPGDCQFVRRKTSSFETARRPLQHGGARSPRSRKQRVQAVVAVDRSLVLFVQVRVSSAEAGAAQQLRIAREVFADRNYLPDGSLVPERGPTLFSTIRRRQRAEFCECFRKRSWWRSTATELPIEAETVCVHGVHARRPSSSRGNCAPI